MKIGHTKNIHNRLGQIQTGCPYRLMLFAVLCTHDNGKSAEALAHERLSNDNYRGEWFKVNKHTLLKTFRNLLIDCDSAYHMKTPRQELEV